MQAFPGKGLIDAHRIEIKLDRKATHPKSD